LKEGILLDPKWISSFYALVATALCTLIFTYKGIDFFDAFVKTFFTAISFYLFGIATAAAVNFVGLQFLKKEEDEAQEENTEQEEEALEDEQQQEETQEAE